MTPDQILQLVTTGGGIAVLALGLALILRGDLVTRGHLTEVRTERDEWKAIAKDAVGDVGELGEALTVRNRIDEEVLNILRAGAKAGGS